MKPPLWRSLDEYAGSPDFHERLSREFPALASEWPEDLSRRNFLKLMGASLALAGATACTRQPLEKIVPYVQQPEELLPGQPLSFATALLLGGHARGVLVESHEGRPTKIEGNPDHPASLGASDIFMQAELLGLYDPDRSQRVTSEGRTSTWDAFESALAQERTRWQTEGGTGVRLLTSNVTSPTVLHQIGGLLMQFPGAKWHVYEPLAPRNPAPLFDLSRVSLIVSFGSDFLGAGPAQLSYTRALTQWRTAQDKAGSRRLYVLESTPTLTGAAADVRIPLTPSALLSVAEKALQGGELGGDEMLSSLSSDLHDSGRNVLILIDDSFPREHQDLAWDWNKQFDQEIVRDPDKMFELAPPRLAPQDSLGALTDDLNSGKVKSIFILGGNPAYDAPADYSLKEKLSKVPFRVRLGLYEDETSSVCQWHLPEAHPLEAWGDARSLDGTVTIMQPLIEPLYDSKSTAEVLALLVGESTGSGYENVRRYWQTQHSGTDFELFWRRALHSGVVPRGAERRQEKLEASAKPLPAARASSEGGLELLFRQDPHIYDGRFANNAWLQELPKPFTKLTWDNAALISPGTAQRLKLGHEDVVELSYRGRRLNAPVCILPGQADNCVTLHLGYGRTHGGRIAEGVGCNAYILRTSDAPWGGPGLEISKTGGRYALATTQQHQNMEGRDLVRTGTLAQALTKPELILQGKESPPEPAESLYPPVAYPAHAWGMAIDLGACTGCNVCTIACQAENNIPVVGKAEVARGRIMHWIRVDNYNEGAAEAPAFHFQPVPCMHCENAPCELVCPVAATVHSSEGLNQMVYNRCIGTRYCSNNCPYKVRRFNFLEYHEAPLESAPVLALLRNPEVTVRTRGVMEKCTYCIQRINRVRLRAEKKNVPIRDGEIVPACAQACPAQAITFGDINDRLSSVAKKKASPLNYGLLAELNTRPRTTYLAKIRNPPARP